jgi:hypothetical protein
MLRSCSPSLPLIRQATVLGQRQMTVSLRSKILTRSDLELAFNRLGSSPHHFGFERWRKIRIRLAAFSILLLSISFPDQGICQSSTETSGVPDQHEDGDYRNPGLREDKKRPLRTSSPARHHAVISSKIEVRKAQQLEEERKACLVIKVTRELGVEIAPIPGLHCEVPQTPKP